MLNIKFSLVACVILCFSGFVVNAQGVFAPVKGAKWTYVVGVSEYTSISGSYDNYHQSEKLSYTKDTTVRGQVYKLINDVHESVGARINLIINTNTGKVVGHDTFPYHDRKNISWMVRQSNDTVWSLVNVDTIERVYFVFTARRDTIALKHFYPNSRFDTGRVFIDSIGTYQIGTRTFKAWQGRSLYEYANDIVTFLKQKLTFLDRIGPLDDLPFYAGFNNYLPYVLKNYPFGLVCYEDPEIGLVQFLNVDCNMPLISATQDLAPNPPADAVKVYFAPGSQKIMIESKELDLTGWEATLINLNGQVLLKKTLNGTMIQLAAPDRITNGVYFTRLYNKTSGARFINKLLIYF